VPVLNTFAVAFFQKQVDRAVLVLNALLGLGTALAPVFVALFVVSESGGPAVLVGALILGLMIFSASQTLDEGAPSATANVQKGKIKFPARFWVFAVFALLYGVCETMNGNWQCLT